MKTSEPSWVKKADDAMIRAALRARELAIKTNTPLHIVKDGKIINILAVEKKP
jgi:hypothetical protein